MSQHSPTCDGNGEWWHRGDAVLVHDCIVREARDRAMPDWELRRSEDACARRVHVYFHGTPDPDCRWCAEVVA